MTGLKTLASEFSAKERLDRFSSFFQSKGLTVFIRIDHAAYTNQIGLQLRPTKLILFGSLKAGTVLMQDKRTAGLDLPMKTLAWEDESGKFG